MNSDFTVALKTNDVKVHKIDHDEDWHVTLADTGALTMTGARVARAAAKYLGNAQHFAVTYGDGLTDADLAARISVSLAQGRIGTVLGVNPPSRFGELKLDATKSSNSQKSRNFPTTGSTAAISSSSAISCATSSRTKDACWRRSHLVKLARDRELGMWKHAASGTPWTPNATANTSTNYGKAAMRRGVVK